MLIITRIANRLRRTLIMDKPMPAEGYRAKRARELREQMAQLHAAGRGRLASPSEFTLVHVLKSDALDKPLTSHDASDKV